MNDAEVVVVQTGTANLASILTGLTRAGTRPVVSNDPGMVEDAARVVLPGVGTLSAAMERLARDGLIESLRRRITRGRATLAVCLGLQMLCEGSEENDDLGGLGAVRGWVTRFGNGVRVPQLGWNRITPDDDCRLLGPGFAYFANSYRLERAPDGWVAATADYGGRFVAAMERGAILACQFHPELSGEFGLGLIERWLKAGEQKC